MPLLVGSCTLDKVVTTKLLVDRIVELRKAKHDYDEGPLSRPRIKYEEREGKEGEGKTIRKTMSEDDQEKVMRLRLFIKVRV